MSRIRLMLIPVLFCLAVSPVLAEEGAESEENPEATQPCETESGEPCPGAEGEEEELERGFDPCLINASLPACAGAAEKRDSSEAGETPPDAQDDGPS